TGQPAQRPVLGAELNDLATRRIPATDQNGLQDDAGQDVSAESTFEESSLLHRGTSLPRCHQGPGGISLNLDGLILVDGPGLDKVSGTRSADGYGSVVRCTGVAIACV